MSLQCYDVVEGFLRLCTEFPGNLNLSGFKMTELLAFFTISPQFLLICAEKFSNLRGAFN